MPCQPGKALLQVWACAALQIRSHPGVFCEKTNHSCGLNDSAPFLDKSHEHSHGEHGQSSRVSYILPIFEVVSVVVVYRSTVKLNNLQLQLKLRHFYLFIFLSSVL